ncbi:MAG: 6-phosphogluconolactonase [Marinobacter sp.]
MSDVNWPVSVRPVLLGDAMLLAGQLTREVVTHLTVALTKRERASLAVSGGSTPKAFFELLSVAPLDWARVDVTLVDERWVDQRAPDSNERLVKQHLLQNGAARANFVGLRQAGSLDSRGQGACESALGGMTWPLDVVVLGMGNDGHTASFFPDAPELLEALGPDNPAKCIALTPASQPQRRVSLTFSALRAASFVALHIKGDDKLETLKKAVGNLDDVRAMPVRAFFRQSISVFWSP